MNKPVVFITGSSRGIGKAIAFCFAKKGYRIVINALNNSEHLKDTERELEILHAEYLSFVGDIGNPYVVSDIFNKINEAFGSINILINNAGISHIGLMTEMSVAEWQSIINTNLSSVFYCCKEAVPEMIRHKKGRIINISSVWGDTGSSCETAYSASKGGVNAFTKALAKELAPSNIQVNAIAFGAIDTDMNSCFSEDEIKQLTDEIPAGRMASVSEAAEFVFEIAVNTGSYFTGQVIAFDGGWQ